ncbi:MAG: zf-HC2 domain-containing protein [bacterium]
MLNNLIACNLVTSNLSAFIDRELDEDFDYEIKKHLSVCLDCRRKFSKMLKINHLMKKYFKGHLKTDLKMNFMKIMSFI